MRNAILLLSVCLGLFPAGASAGDPSFNCNAAQRSDEVLICQSDELSALDRELSSIYSRLRNSLAVESRRQLENSQAGWLRSRMQCGRDAGCVESAYRTRIDILNQYGASNREAAAEQNSPGVAAEFILPFQRLPKEIQDHAVQVRESCKELVGEKQYSDDMQGIDIVDLNGDGSHDIVVDDQGLCDSRMGGANCFNHDCQMTIYKEIGTNRWRKIFEEALYAKFLASDWGTRRFQLMIVALYAGDPKCHPAPNKDYISVQSCNLIVTYENNKWSWQLIR